MTEGNLFAQTLVLFELLLVRKLLFSQRIFIDDLIGDNQVMQSMWCTSFANVRLEQFSGEA